MPGGGSSGPTGATGATGATGPTGPAGATGPGVNSATASAVVDASTQQITGNVPVSLALDASYNSPPLLDPTGTVVINTTFNPRDPPGPLAPGSIQLALSGTYQICLDIEANSSDINSQYGVYPVFTLLPISGTGITVFPAGGVQFADRPYLVNTTPQYWDQILVSATLWINIPPSSALPVTVDLQCAVLGAQSLILTRLQTSVIYFNNNTLPI